ncbi:MAG: ArsR family transcriptional regulator [Anaerolineae bacterium]|nr:ArsR family transcriptional regulator [Anaerolineae bacterium]
MVIVGDNDKQQTRDIILHAIKETNEATVEELAAAAGVSPVTVRHHLNSLQAEAILTSRSVRRKVGRPYYVYTLTEKGHELFPHKYARLSTRLLDELKARFPVEVVNDIFVGVVRRMVSEQQPLLDNMGFEQKLDYLVTLLGKEGFLARWEKEGDQYHLIEYSCPYTAVGQEHREVCSLDTNLIIAVLGNNVKQHSCMLAGDSCCQFTVTQN